MSGGRECCPWGWQLPGFMREETRPPPRHPFPRSGNTAPRECIWCGSSGHWCWLCCLILNPDASHLQYSTRVGSPPKRFSDMALGTPRKQRTLKRKQLRRGDRHGGFSEAYYRLPGHGIPLMWVIGTFTFGGEPQCYWNQFSSNGNDVCYFFPSLPPCLIHSRLDPLQESAAQELQFIHWMCAEHLWLTTHTANSQRFREASKMPCLHGAHQHLMQKFSFYSLIIITPNLRQTSGWRTMAQSINLAIDLFACLKNFFFFYCGKIFVTHTLSSYLFLSVQRAASEQEQWAVVVSSLRSGTGLP